MRKTFTDIYENHLWGGESVSGTGSGLEQTRAIRKAIPKLFNKYDISSVLDIPCGDYWWFKEMKLGIAYVGADIVPELIKSNQAHYPEVDFRTLDVATDPLPEVDLVLCRDLLGHFSLADAHRAIANIRASGSEYLLATTFPNAPKEPTDIQTGSWRPINMDWFGLGEPIEIIDEGLLNFAGLPSGKA